MKENTVVVFKGRRDILSNEYPCSIYYDNIWFNCVQQAYQYEKARFHDYPELSIKILKLKSCFEQAKCTQFIETTNEWLHSKRMYIMKQILTAKLECVPEYKQLLLNSKGTVVNAAPNERFWSCGLSKADVFCKKATEWLGQNVLGKLHMALRTELHSERALIAAHEEHMLQYLHSEKHNVKSVVVDIGNVLVTVHAKNLQSAYHITDRFAIPRKSVRVMIGSQCY